MWSFASLLFILCINVYNRLFTITGSLRVTWCSFTPFMFCLESTLPRPPKFDDKNNPKITVDKPRLDFLIIFIRLYLHSCLSFHVSNS